MKLNLLGRVGLYTRLLFFYILLLERLSEVLTVMALQLTVASIKLWLQDRGLNFSGKKADLITAVENYLKQK